MVEDTAISLSISLGAVFIVTFVLGGLDIKTAIVTTFTIILILVSSNTTIQLSPMKTTPLLNKYY